MNATPLKRKAGTRDMADTDDTGDPVQQAATFSAADERGERFAQLIRNARRTAGVSQDDVAHHTGISRSQIIRWESGGASRPDPGYVRAVCTFLGIDPRDAAIALGYLSREEAYGASPRLLPAMVEEVIELLADPTVPDEQKNQWIDYLRFLVNKPRPSSAGVMPETRTASHRKATKPTASGVQMSASRTTSKTAVNVKSSGKSAVTGRTGDRKKPLSSVEDPPPA